MRRAWLLGLGHDYVGPAHPHKADLVIFHAQPGGCLPAGENLCLNLGLLGAAPGSSSMQRTTSLHRQLGS